MVGITHIQIINKADDWRFTLSEACAPFIDPILRNMFNDAGIKLYSGEKREECTKEDLTGRYDLNEGIDIILRYKDVSLKKFETHLNCNIITRSTLQIKTLFSDYNTLTIEIEKNTGAPGAWQYTTAQYYATFYTQEDEYTLKNNLVRNQYGKLEPTFRNNFKPTIRNGIIVNYPAFRDLSNDGKIPWKPNINSRDSRKSKFIYVPFNEIPESCIIAKWPL